MAEPSDTEPVPIGFEGLVTEPSDGQKAYTVTFSPSESDPAQQPSDSDPAQQPSESEGEDDTEPPGKRPFTAAAPIPSGSEEIKLIERGAAEEKVCSSLSVYSLWHATG